MEFFIVREANSRGDVATIWNWKKGEWCWDVDGDYTAADGFAYTSMHTARVRAEKLMRAENLHNYRVDRKLYTGIRVVTRKGLEIIRHED